MAMGFRLPVGSRVFVVLLREALGAAKSYVRA